MSIRLADDIVDFCFEYEGKILRGGGPYCPVECEAFMWCRRNDKFIHVPVRRKMVITHTGVTVPQVASYTMENADWHVRASVERGDIQWNLFILRKR